MSEQNGFFTDGEAYDRAMGRMSRIAGEKFLDWLSLPDGLQWLGIGCGTGSFSELILARNAPGAIVAIDPSEEQIAYTKTKPSAGVIDYRCGGGCCESHGGCCESRRGKPHGFNNLASVDELRFRCNLVARYVFWFLNQHDKKSPFLLPGQQYRFSFSKTPQHCFPFNHASALRLRFFQRRHRC